MKQQLADLSEKGLSLFCVATNIPRVLWSQSFLCNQKYRHSRIFVDTLCEREVFQHAFSFKRPSWLKVKMSLFHLCLAATLRIHLSHSYV